MGAYALIAPEIVVLATALVVMFADVVSGGRRRAAAWIGAAGALAAAGLALWAGTCEVRVFGGMLAVDGAAQFARVATTLLTAVFLVWLAGKGMGTGKVRHAAALVLLSTLGSLLVASARDWVVLFLALETATMPLYVLVGYDRGDERSLEGALKYFLLSMITSVTMLYGLSFVLGMTGSTAFTGARLAAHGGLGLFAAVLVVAGLMAKLSAAPFHWWAPDAYAGAPAAAVAFVSAAPKVAGAAALARVVSILAPQVPGLSAVLLTAAVASMVLGNLAAYPQRDIRRLMAYSGVAHAGYILLAVGSGSALGLRAAVFYAAVYAVPSMAVLFVAADEGNAVDDFAGVAARRPWTAIAATALLLSLVGVPPLAGFFGKLYVFGATLDAGLVALSVAGVLMSVVSAGFYLRIVRAMFFGERTRVALADRDRTVAADVAFGVAVAATLAMGAAAGPLLSMMGLSLP